MTVACHVGISAQIASGYVKRCLPLADAVEAKGGYCQFIRPSCARRQPDQVHSRHFAHDARYSDF